VYVLFICDTVVVQGKCYSGSVVEVIEEGPPDDTHATPPTGRPT
jgi:hypothetical protein